MIQQNNMPTDFKLLDQVILEIGASNEPTSPLQSTGETSPISIQIRKDGIVVGREAYGELDGVPGLLSYKGEHCFLYIDHFKRLGVDTTEILEEVPCVEGPKFHMTKCRTLEQMHNDGRSDRYVLIRNTEGEFPCFPHNENNVFYDFKIKAKLLPCKNCLNELSYRGYSTSWANNKKEEFVNNFSISEFVNRMTAFFFDKVYYNSHPTHAQHNRVDDPKIREERIARLGPVCEECEVDLRDHCGLLHLHHVSGNAGNNWNSNLKLLCILCHSQQPKHQHMKGMDRVVEGTRIILRLRNEQGI